MQRWAYNANKVRLTYQVMIDSSFLLRPLILKIKTSVMGNHSCCLEINIPTEENRAKRLKDRSLLITLMPVDPAVLNSQTSKYFPIYSNALNCVPATCNKKAF